MEEQGRERDGDDDAANKVWKFEISKKNGKAPRPPISSDPPRNSTYENWRTLEHLDIHDKHSLDTLFDALNWNKSNEMGQNNNMGKTSNKAQRIPGN
jgi:hypothetical protein